MNKEPQPDELILAVGRLADENAEEEQSFADLPLIQQLTHKSLKGRIYGLQQVNNELQKSAAASKQPVIDEESLNHLTLNPDILFSESSPEAQKLVLLFYKTAFLDGKRKSDNWDFGKKPFWYNFLDKFICSPKAHIKEASNAFFEDLMKVVDQRQLADIGIEFLNKNNIKLIKAVLTIFTDKFDVFRPWDGRMTQLAVAVDKLLLNPHGELKSMLKAFLRKILMSGHGEMIGMLKNAKPGFADEIYPEGRVEMTPVKAGGESRGRPTDILTTAHRPSKQKIPLIDLYKHAEPVSIIPKFAEVWIESVKSMRKWNEKTAAIDEFIKAAAAAQKLQHTDNYGNIVALAKILLEHSNIHVQISALKVFGALAAGLRLHGRPYIRQNFNLLISKFRDKKVIVLEALHAAIKEIFYCLTVEEIYEEVRTFNTERNKDIRLNVLVMAKNLFCFLIETRDQAKNLPTFLRLFSEALNVYYEDQDIEVRNLTNELTLFILETLEEDPENLRLFKDKVDSKKVKPRSTHKEVKAPVPKAVTIFTEKARESEGDLPSIQTAGNVPLKRSLSEKRKSAGPDAKTNPNAPRPYVYKANEMSPDDVILSATELIPEEVRKLLKSDDWKTKAEGLKSLNAFFESTDALQIDSKFVKTVFGLLRSEFKDYKESNVICIKLISDSFCILISKTELIDDLVFEFIPFMIRKITESKFQQNLTETFKIALKKLPFHKVLYLTLMHKELLTNPKTIMDLFNLYASAAEKGVVYSAVDLKAFVLVGLNSQNQATRKAAISFLTSVAGGITSEGFLEIVSGVENKNLAKSLENEIMPLVGKADQSPERSNKKTTVPESAQKRRQSLTDKDHLTERGSLLNIAVPQQSLGSMLAGLVKQDWKVRKEAVEAYMSYLENNPQHFSVLGVHETYQNINLRLNDSQRVVAVLALNKFKAILPQYFHQLKPYHKLIIENMIDNLVDKNVT